MSELLPALLIVLPIVGATLPLGVGLLRENVGWSIAALVLSVEAGLAAWLAAAVYGGEGAARIVHVLGGETFGRRGATENFVVGIELVADAFSGLMVLLVAGVALGVLAFARRGGPRGNAFYSGYLLLTGGLMGLFLTGDLFNLFVFLEIVGLTTYGLVASDRDAESAVAALKYLVIGTTGASLYLIGVGYLFLRTGALNMVDVSRSLAGEPRWIDGALYGDPLVLAAFGFVAVGLMTKAAIYPLHTWQPDAYAAAPDAVTVYISALVSTGGAYAFARVTWTVFTPEFFAVGQNARILELVIVLACLSVVLGSGLAAMQRRLKRLFAYSSVSQFGLIVIGVCVAVHPAGGTQATRLAVYGVVIHLLGHGLIKGGLFATVGALARGTGARRVQKYAGLAKRRPFLSGSMAVLGLAIVGVPPTIGFLGKWYLAVGALNTELWPVIFVVFASTLLTLLYVGRLLETLYFDGPAEGAAPAAEPEPEGPGAPGGADGAVMTDGAGSLSYGMIALAVSAAVLTVLLGFAGSALTDAAQPIAQAVIEAAPEVGADG
jgi:multicomponent Na+:H+ antiporter subunit D